MLIQGFLPTAGAHVNESHITADYIAAIIGGVALAVSVLILPIKNEDKPSLLLLWAIKVALNLLFIPIYEAHYPGFDAGMYFMRGALEVGSPPLPQFGVGTDMTIYAIYLVTRVLPSYFHLLEMLWSFIGLLAIYFFYRAFRLLFIDLTPRFLLLVGLFPSVLFWSSILGKDPIVLLGIALYVYGVARWSSKRGIRGLAVAAVGVLLATAFRPWLAMIMAAPMIVFPLKRPMPGWQKSLLGIMVLAGVIFATQLFLEKFQIDSTSELTTTAYHLGQGWARGGSAQRIGSGFHGLLAMIEFAPLGMFTALFRPLPGEVHNLFGLLAGFTNLVLLSYFLLALKHARRRIVMSAQVLWLIVFILTWALLYGFVSYQNLGTASRFELQILPVLWPLVFLLGRRRVPRLRRRPENSGLSSLRLSAYR